MNRKGHDDVNFFVGSEVEHTPAFSKKTLFVVGKQPVEMIESLARKNKTPHIFLGANHSFDIDSTDTTSYWDRTITELLDKGFWVTLDYPAHQHEKVLVILNAGIWQCKTFVPMLSVRIPNVQTSSPNLVVKIDDIDFNATNAGVWCFHHHELTDSNRFTGWVEYENDEVLELEEIKNTEVKQELSEVKNDQEVGLDKSIKSKDIDIAPVKTAEDAAQLYAEGTTEDPLSKESSKKNQKAKK